MRLYKRITPILFKLSDDQYLIGVFWQKSDSLKEFSNFNIKGNFYSKSDGKYQLSYFILDENQRMYDTCFVKIYQRKELGFNKLATWNIQLRLEDILFIDRSIVFYED